MATYNLRDHSTSYRGGCNRRRSFRFASLRCTTPACSVAESFCEVLGELEQGKLLFLVTFFRHEASEVEREDVENNVLMSLSARD